MTWYIFSINHLNEKSITIFVVAIESILLIVQFACNCTATAATTLKKKKQEKLLTACQVNHVNILLSGGVYQSLCHNEFIFQLILSYARAHGAQDGGIMLKRMDFTNYIIMSTQTFLYLV